MVVTVAETIQGMPLCIFEARIRGIEGLMSYCGIWVGGNSDDYLVIESTEVVHAGSGSIVPVTESRKTSVQVASECFFLDS